MWNKLQRWFKAGSSARQLLSDEQMDSWSRNGFLVLKGFFTPQDINVFEDEVAQLIQERAQAAGEVVIDVLDGPLTGKRIKLRDAPQEAIDHTHKINDLYLVSDNCRSLNLHHRLVAVLNDVLGAVPVVVNSLSFTKGSQQPHHFDTYYMPPPVEGRMVVSSICLEKQTLEAGPLSYYPGSHLIPPYRFSHGGLAAVNDELPDARRYIQAQLAERGLTPDIFVGDIGDVFIWHGQLYHGGSAIADHNRTRRTLVTHYWASEDLPIWRQVKLNTGGAYLSRDHQPIPQ
ncbi:phytanoyl-CoA dioxygenase family protein [Cellvibrio japonicus]|uniref:Phytanoyl-CoA dioxygenase (PhyH) family n=1 Tax=Cellvibrio japonicus (strain Ueda107) TaxID=498211 RepID=B3PGV1_CELJU|nr:phytanoyl-CoA dioxygenase family protein [Cellvibrio japonicus]ACE85407.1 Phytanoyl-CoA dioxygenase (PhyH) family [Cellvibrio japonicus Ueda107]QEI13762.1 phytanoyl-CoA dioxygenase family protein [Cellvibrio japonicus]QEI17336.1 phytanoyl-CoA dioxygenase family protein [Cellvibrio japonicus]QEI20913.1 phytanoyl-CoA dioxygenase family protein [Cellvibrio japonicus]